MGREETKQGTMGVGGQNDENRPTKNPNAYPKEPMMSRDIMGNTYEIVPFERKLGQLVASAQLVVQETVKPFIENGQEIGAISINIDVADEEFDVDVSAIEEE